MAVTISVYNGIRLVGVCDLMCVAMQIESSMVNIDNVWNLRIHGKFRFIFCNGLLIYFLVRIFVCLAYLLKGDVSLYSAVIITIT